MGKILLAPMDGLADCVLREVLTRIGGYDGAVSEFIRVSGSLLPQAYFSARLPGAGQRQPHAPWHARSSCSCSAAMRSAWRRTRRSSPSCRRPGSTLTSAARRRPSTATAAGATLLADPELIGRIAGAVRQAVPPAIPVSAKMRLGVSDTARAIDCAQALAAGGVASLVVHARTRDEGYRPPAHWEWGGENSRSGEHCGDRQRRSVDRAGLSALPAGDRLRRRDDRAAARSPTPFLARRIRASLAGETLRGRARRRLARALAGARRFLAPGSAARRAAPCAGAAQTVAQLPAPHLHRGRCALLCGATAAHS